MREAVGGGRGEGGAARADLPPRVAAVLTTLIEHLAEIIRPVAQAAAGLAGTWLVAEAIVEVARVAPAGALTATMSVAAAAGAGGGGSLALSLLRGRRGPVAREKGGADGAGS